MNSNFFDAVLRRFLHAVSAAALGFVFGIPAGPLAGAVAAATCGFVVGLGDGDPFGSAGSWLLMALGFWGGLASVYVVHSPAASEAPLVEPFGSAMPVLSPGPWLAAASVYFTACKGHRGHSGSQLLFTAGTVSGALAGWFGGLASAPSPPSPGGGECLAKP